MDCSNVLVGNEPLQAGTTEIPDGEEFQIGSETFVFDRGPAGSDVRMSERLTQTQRPQNEELDTFALDPMTWDAPSSARPTRRYYRPGRAGRNDCGETDLVLVNLDRFHHVALLTMARTTSMPLGDFTEDGVAGGALDVGRA